MSYNIADDGLLVMRNGKVLNKDEYVKTSSTVVTLVNGAIVGDILEFIYYYSSTGLQAVAWELIDSHTIGDTVISLSFSYSVGTHQLFVMRNGAMQVVGASYDYTETSTSSITLTTPIVKVDEEILVFKFGTIQDSMNHKMSFHDDAPEILAPGQTYRDLAISCESNTQVVIKAGTKVLDDTWVGAIAFASDVTVDITNIGVKNGLDTGSEALNTWYYIWAIKDPTTPEVAGLLSASSTSPTLPAGFTKKRLIGAVKNDGASNFRPFHQYGLDVIGKTGNLYGGTITNNSSVVVSAASFIPPISNIALILASGAQVTGAGVGMSFHTGHGTLTADCLSNYFALTNPLYEYESSTFDRTVDDSGQFTFSVFECDAAHTHMILIYLRGFRLNL